MKKICLLLFTTLLMISCANDDTNEAPIINIRLANNSQFSFENIKVQTTNATVSYENIGPGESSAYQVYNFAYSYAAVELEINGEIYTIQPVDFASEVPLASGDYTYQISVDESQEQELSIFLTFIVD